MPEPDDAHDDTAARLRAALSSRAAAVEPADADPVQLAARARRARAAHRRRAVLLSAAAAVAVLAAIAGAVVVAGDDDEDLATGGPSSTAATSSTTTSTSSSTTTSTSTTAPPIDDDGVPGWPGFTSRVFNDPQSAALNFVMDVLGFADPHQSYSEGHETDALFTFNPRPTATVGTDVRVHNTGSVRGWVVTGVTSDQGTIDSATFDGTTVALSGSATAFEATVHVAVLDQEGNVLAESFTMAGANGEQGPFETTIDVDAGAGTPFWVMIAESDASGEGTFTWAATATLPAA